MADHKNRTLSRPLGLGRVELCPTTLASQYSAMTEVVRSAVFRKLLFELD
jgi:hypothetical protein